MAEMEAAGREAADWGAAKAVEANSEGRWAAEGKEVEVAAVGARVVGRVETEEEVKVAGVRALEAMAEAREVATLAAALTAAEPRAVDAVMVAPGETPPDGVEVTQAVVVTKGVVPPVGCEAVLVREEMARAQAAGARARAEMGG